MRKITLASDADYLRLILYGRPGVGKTRTAATAALDERMSPVLMLDASANPMSIRNYPKQPDVIRMEMLTDFNMPYDWIRRGQSPDHPLMKMFDLHPPYKTLIIDQLTQWQRMFFAQAMNYASNPKYGPGDLVPRREWEHYNKVLYSMVNAVSLYCSLPIHIIMVAQESNKDPSSTDGVVGMALEGQSAIEIGSYVYAVGRIVPRARVGDQIMKVLEEATKTGTKAATVVFWTSWGGYDAKDQYGSLGQFMVDPNMTMIYDCIFGKNDADTTGVD